MPIITKKFFWKSSKNWEKFFAHSLFSVTFVCAFLLSTVFSILFNNCFQKFIFSSLCQSVKIGIGSCDIKLRWMKLLWKVIIYLLKLFYASETCDKYHSIITSHRITEITIIYTCWFTPALKNSLFYKKIPIHQDYTFRRLTFKLGISKFVICWIHSFNWTYWNWEKNCSLLSGNWTRNICSPLRCDTITRPKGGRSYTM